MNNYSNILEVTGGNKLVGCIKYTNTILHIKLLQECYYLAFDKR